MRNALKIKFVLCALVAAAMATAGCASLFLHGKVKNESYVAPAEMFSCPIPHLPDVKVQDSADEEKMCITAGTVSFVSWLGVYRIDYMGAYQAPIQEELNRMLKTQLDWYRKIPSPKAYVLHQEFDGERLFAVLVAPEGQLNAVDGYGKHIDLCRAMLIFKHGYYIYAVSADANDSIGTKSDDKSPERINRLRKKTDEFAGSIKFLTPATTN
jgi:hypothetical protein